MSHKRILTLGAAAATLLAGAAGAAFAHPHPEGEGEKVERIVVVRDGAGGDHHGKPGKHEMRRFEIIGGEGGHDGKPGKRKVRRFEIIGADGGHHGKPGGPRVRRFEMHGDVLAHCDGGEKIVEEGADEGGKKTKVVICTRGRPSAAAAERLEEALARINDNDELSAEAKARIATALKSAIDRARSAR